MAYADGVGVERFDGCGNKVHQLEALRLCFVSAYVLFGLGSTLKQLDESS